MKHTAPQFWQYAAAYILLASGTFLIVLEAAEWAFVGTQFSLLGGLFAIAMGVMTLNSLKQLTSKGPAPDKTEDKN